MEQFIINPKQYKRNNAYLLLLCLWGSVLVGFIALASYHGFWVLAGFAALLFFIIPYAFYQRNLIDVLRIDESGLLITNNRRSDGGVRIALNSPLELTLEWNERSKGSEYGQESVSSLNLWDTDAGYRRRHILGMWLSQEDREVVFYELLEFLKQGRYDVKTKNEVSIEQQSQQE